MSGICGIATVESHPVDEKILRYMTEAAPHRGLDGVITWQNEHFSVAHLSRFITPESQHEHQPLVSGPIILAADARIDNRDDLIKLLGLTGDTPTDADLILQAYQRWGTDFPRYLIGDFAFALWDDHEKRLLLARDPMGMRALYYRLEANRVLFATEIKQIIAVPGVPVEIFEPALAAYLVGPNMPPEWTYYKGIDQLTAGHMLLFEGGRVKVQRFWDADPNYRIHYKDENEYVEHFRELFKTAVACRMRSIKPVGLSLSGGMDSGSIASIVGTLKQHGSTAYPDFVALCYAYDEYPQCDERHISSQITDYFGLESIDVPTNQGWPLIDYPAHGPDQDEPYMGVYQALYELALKMCQERNIGTLMSGDRGDLLTAGWSFDHRGMLFRGRWRKLWQELREDSAFRRRPILKIIRQEILPPVWPAHRAPETREKLRRLAGRPPKQHKYPPWVRDDFAQANQLDEIATQYHDPPSPIREFGRRQRYRLIFTSMHMRGVVWSERTQARFGVEFADPWSDRRLAEFILAIPHDVVNKPREYKRITYNAMQGVMPESVRQSVGKTLPEDFYLGTLRGPARETVLDLIENSVAHERGYINKVVLKAEFDSILAGNRDHASFWWVLTIEMWLRQYWS